MNRDQIINFRKKLNRETRIGLINKSLALEKQKSAQQEEPPKPENIKPDSELSENRRDIKCYDRDLSSAISRMRER